MDRQDYDAVVVGGGAAGLSAGLTLARARRSVRRGGRGQPAQRPGGRRARLPHPRRRRPRRAGAARDRGGAPLRRRGGGRHRDRGRRRPRPRRRGDRLRRPPRRRHAGAGPPGGRRHGPGRRAAGRAGGRRAVGPRRRALPVLPRLRGPRPGARRAGHRARSPCTRRCCSGSGATTSPCSSTPRPGPPTRSASSSRPGTSPWSRARSPPWRWPTTGSSACGWPPATSSPREVLVVGAPAVARDGFLAGVGLVSEELEMMGHVVGRSVPAVAPDRGDGRARRLRGRQRHRPARAGGPLRGRRGDGRRGRQRRPGHGGHRPGRGRPAHRCRLTAGPDGRRAAPAGDGAPGRHGPTVTATGVLVCAALRVVASTRTRYETAPVAAGRHAERPRPRRARRGRRDLGPGAARDRVLEPDRGGLRGGRRPCGP